jgi:hypothetical protein
MAGRAACALLQAKIEDEVDQRRAQAPAPGVVAAIRRRAVVEVLGRRGRSHEQAPVVEVRPVQQLRRDGVEERLGAFGLAVIDDQADEATLDLRPECIGTAGVRLREVEVALDARHRFGDAAIVEIDAVVRDVADREPVAGFEMALGRARALAEQRVVPVEALEQDLGDDLRRRDGRRRRIAIIALRGRAHRGHSAPAIARQLPFAFSICAL